MGANSITLGKITEMFTLSGEQAKYIACGFQKAMEQGLAGLPSPLKMLPTYLTLPDGDERGIFPAIDFGGTNLRVLLVELPGNGRMAILERRVVPLINSAYTDNLLSAQATAVQLFDFIAEQVAALRLAEGPYALGHTFSFPCLQTDLNHAVLLGWTKEIQTSGVEGQDVNRLLRAALERKGFNRVIPKALINDTVGTLLTAAYDDPCACMAAICGTGFNICYLESHALKKPMIINMEAGNFDQLPFTIYDDLVDRDSGQPGLQRLEKMVSGRYIGEIFRVALQQMSQEKLVSISQDDGTLGQPYAVTAECLSLILGSGEQNLCGVDTWLHKRGIIWTKMEDRVLVRALAALIMRRSARLVVSTFLGVLSHLDPAFAGYHSIALDGSLYEKMPGYKEEVAKAITEFAGPAAEQISIRLVKDGSGFGAAIAAALAK